MPQRWNLVGGASWPSVRPSGLEYVCDECHRRDYRHGTSPVAVASYDPATNDLHAWYRRRTREPIIEGDRYLIDFERGAAVGRIPGKDRRRSSWHKMQPGQLGQPVECDSGHRLLVWAEFLVDEYMRLARLGDRGPALLPVVDWEKA